MNDFEKYEAEQKERKEFLSEEGKFVLERVGVGVVCPSGKGSPYMFPTRGEAWKMARRISNGPLMADEWIVREAR